MKYRKCNNAKRSCSSCANNGSCPHCVGSRTHANEQALPADLTEQMIVARFGAQDAWFGWPTDYDDYDDWYHGYYVDWRDSHPDTESLAAPFASFIQVDGHS